jgi:hypothetical protein
MLVYSYAAKSSDRPVSPPGRRDCGVWLHVANASHSPVTKLSLYLSAQSEYKVGFASAKYQHISCRKVTLLLKTDHTSKNMSPRSFCDHKCVFGARKFQETLNSRNIVPNVRKWRTKRKRRQIVTLRMRRNCRWGGRGGQESAHEEIRKVLMKNFWKCSWKIWMQVTFAEISTSKAEILEFL